MKKIVISTLAVLIACPAFAAGRDPYDTSWQLFGLDPYIGLRGGASYNTLNYGFNGHKDTMTDMVFQGRVALGLEVCDTVRSEIEWSGTHIGNSADIISCVRSLDWVPVWRLQTSAAMCPRLVTTAKAKHVFQRWARWA